MSLPTAMDIFSTGELVCLLSCSSLLLSGFLFQGENYLNKLQTTNNKLQTTNSLSFYFVYTNISLFGLLL